MSQISRIVKKISLEKKNFASSSETVLSPKLKNFFNNEGIIYINLIKSLYNFQLQADILFIGLYGNFTRLQSQSIRSCFLLQSLFIFIFKFEWLKPLASSTLSKSSNYM